MPGESVTLVILGASGDLTHRLLLPGLGTLLRAKPDYDIRLIGFTKKTTNNIYREIYYIGD